MSKTNYLILPFLFLSLLFTTSCEETEGIDEYANWKERNDVFIDSIANVAAVNTTGEWRKYLSFNKSASLIGSTSSAVEDYIYVRVLAEGESTEEILYSDTVSLSYRGRLRNDVVFDQTYTHSEFDPEFVTSIKPTSSSGTIHVGGFVDGFATALMYMHPGDRFEVYMHWSLAYGESKSDAIPAYSSLVFDIYVEDVFHPKKKE